MHSSVSIYVRRAAARALAVACGATLALPGVASAAPVPARLHTTPRAERGVETRAGGARLDAIPLYFEEGGTGADRDAQFTARGDGYSVAIGSRGVAVALGGGRDTAPEVVRMRFAGAAAAPRVVADHELAGKINRLSGADPSRWRQGIRTFARVRYEGVYPGVDAVCYGTRRDLEYDFLVRPGADPAAIRLAFDGARSVSVAANGDLVVKTARGEVRQRRPVAYQETTAGRTPVSCGFAVRRGEARFELGAYDRARPLVVDPVISYSTYLGGDRLDEIYSIAVDAAGNMYVTGMSTSDDFPTHNGIPPGPESANIFVTKIAPSGTELVYSTAIHGVSGFNHGYGIAVDAAGDAFVAGAIAGSDFPLVDALSTHYGANQSALLMKLGASGNLIFSTVLGGSAGDAAYGVAVDPAGNPVVVGSTTSRDFPSVSAVQSNLAGESSNDAFVTKVSADGHQILFSTTLGGSSRDEAYGVAVDGAGAIYVTGYTDYDTFPTTAGAFQSVAPACHTDGFDCFNVFVTKISPDSQVAYSTFLGGSSNEVALGITVDAGGSAYLTGWTASPDFPVKNPIQGQPTTIHTEAFVTKIAPDGSDLVYSTLLGGRGEDDGFAIAVDAEGRACVAGRAFGPDFPTVDAVLGFLGTPDAATYGFVTVLNADGTSMLMSSFVGGTLGGAATCVAFGPDGRLYLGGGTASTDFPLQSPLPGIVQSPDGLGLGFVMRLDGVGGDVRSPKVTRVRIKRAAAKAARIVLDGSRFGPGMQIFVGDRTAAGSSIRLQGTTRCIVDNAADLVEALPRGVPARVRCVNADGGEYTVFFTPK